MSEIRKGQGFDDIVKSDDSYQNILTGMYNEMRLREKDEDVEYLKKIIT